MSACLMLSPLRVMKILIVNLNGLFEVVDTRALWRFVDMFQAEPRPVLRCALTWTSTEICEIHAVFW